MLHAKPEIVGIDYPWFDHNIILEKLAGENDTVKIVDSDYSGGGKVATALVASSRLGVSSSLIAPLGTNERERFLYEDFLLNQVQVKHIKQIEGFRSGQSIVISNYETETRQILWQEPSDLSALKKEDIQKAKEDILGAKYLLLCRMDKVGIYAAKLAKDNHVKVAFDADFYEPSIVEKFHLIDIMIASEEFHRSIYKEDPTIETLQDLSKKGPEVVIITLGSRGGVLFYKDKFSSYGIKTGGIKIVDTVGAGDVFHGAYLAALCHGSNYYQSAEYASATSGLKCGAKGGRLGIPTHEIVLNLLKNNVVNQSYLDNRCKEYSRLKKKYSL